LVNDSQKAAKVNFELIPSTLSTEHNSKEYVERDSYFRLKCTQEDKVNWLKVIEMKEEAPLTQNPSTQISDNIIRPIFSSSPSGQNIFKLIKAHPN
jgi:hypothetical protein